MINDACSGGVRKHRICDGIGISIRTLQRWKIKLKDSRIGPISHPKSLSVCEKQKIIEVINSEEFCDFSPHVIVAKLADSGSYLCSVSSMYRLLRSEQLLKHRRRSKAPKCIPKVETIAKRPNEVWCWDITHLPCCPKGQSYKLYMFEDLFSRKIVGYHVDEIESPDIARKLFLQILEKEGINGDGLRMHSDNGNPMRDFTLVAKLKSLGVILTRSRPYVKDDNPFPEALFKTMKYRSNYPYREFGGIEEARKWVECFVGWYNEHHLHSGINYVTPNQRHTGVDKEILQNRKQIFQQAKSTNPIRWAGEHKKWEYQAEIELNSSGCRAI